MTRDRSTVKILKNMKIRRQLSLRGLRSNHSTGVKENEDEIFRTVDRDYRRELRITRSKYGKVVEYINEIYRALANYDVRFDFDPVSVDDHRCEVVSSSELKLTCELKHISKRTCEVHGDTANGRIQIKLRDDVRSHHRYKRAVSWDDVCSKGRRNTEPNYLNTRNLLDVFTTALGRAVRDVWNEHRNLGLVYRVSGNQARLYLDIPDTGFFTVTLIPAIKLTKSTIIGLDSDLLKGEKGDNFSTIYAIAQPNRYFQDESWQLSYKALENRIMNDDQFACGRVCLHALRHLLLSPHKSPRCGIKSLTLSHLQLAVIQEYAKHPHAKDWTPATFMKRLTGTMTSLTLCLREGVCVNQFSGVNEFSHFDLKSLRVLAKDVEHANTKCREKLLKV